jgi:hypothetical protein
MESSWTWKFRAQEGIERLAGFSEDDSLPALKHPQDVLALEDRILVIL